MIDINFEITPLYLRDIRKLKTKPLNDNTYRP